MLACMCYVQIVGDGSDFFFFFWWKIRRRRRRRWRQLRMIKMRLKLMSGRCKTFEISWKWLVSIDDAHSLHRWLRLKDNVICCACVQRPGQMNTKFYAVIDTIDQLIKTFTLSHISHNLTSGTPNNRNFVIWTHKKTVENINDDFIKKSADWMCFTQTKICVQTKTKPKEIRAIFFFVSFELIAIAVALIIVHYLLFWICGNCRCTPHGKFR